MSDRQLKWDLRFLDQARTIATWSKDRSRGVGCVVTRDNRILASGYNGFPPGVNDEVPERHERPAKYLWTEHAERNAIYQAARMGIALEGATMYGSAPPCAPCTRAIGSAGIVRMVWPAVNYFDTSDPKWSDDFLVARLIAQEVNGTGIIFDVIEEAPC